MISAHQRQCCPAAAPADRDRAATLGTSDGRGQAACESDRRAPHPDEGAQREGGGGERQARQQLRASEARCRHRPPRAPEHDHAAPRACAATASQAGGGCGGDQFPGRVGPPTPGHGHAGQRRHRRQQQHQRRQARLERVEQHARSPAPRRSCQPRQQRPDEPAVGARPTSRRVAGRKRAVAMAWSSQRRPGRAGPAWRRWRCRPAGPGSRRRPPGAPRPPRARRRRARCPPSA